jgi:hypothetical protein
MPKNYPNTLLSVVAKEREEGEAREEGAHRRQAVFNIDFSTWESLIDAFDIKQCLIPHRIEQKPENEIAGWYS